jgi:hypothetical protein
LKIAGMQGTPTLVLIDRAGVMRMQHFGQVDDLQLGVLLGRLLAEGEVGETAAAAPDDGNEQCDGGACAVRE